MESFGSFFKNKKILITGGAGAIGGQLARRLVELGAGRIVILDNLSSSYTWNIARGGNVQFIEGDILDEEKLRWAFKCRPEIVYHLAAHFANQNSVDNPETDLMVNGVGILKVLQYAQLTGVERFVYSSSGCGVYGLDSKMPFEEHDVSIRLHTPYQVTKLLGELYTNYFYSMHGLPIVNARFFNSYGPGEVPGQYRNVIPNFMFWAMKGIPLPITGDGTETRDWTFVGDIVTGLLLMGVRDEAVGEAFNLGNGHEQHVIDMASRILELTGSEAGITFTQRRDWDVKTRLLSCIDKARTRLGYEPKIPFERGLERTYEWFVDNWENIKSSAEFASPAP
ncbi:MAG: NAD-dependent epimerase/dehydratase family protein [Methanospirillum sp.]|nr:NAD-dependent epimerase/dehydratase family protein [Methanospirillum sp.]